MTEWGEPVKGTGSTHDWNAEPELIATFDRTDEVDVPDSAGGMRASKMHRFLRDGVLVDVWGSFDLDAKLRGAKPGVLTRIVFTGVKELAGDRTMKQFTVQFDASGNAADPVMVDSDDDIPF